PGKVPMRVIRQRYGQSVRQEVMGDLIQSSFFEAAHKQNISPAGLPRIDELDLDAARYVAVFEVMPEISLADMSGVSIKRPQVEIADADVDRMVEQLRKQRASWVAVERPAQDADQVLVSFKGYVDDEAFEGGSAEDVPVVLGSGSLIEGFESGLLGASAGDSRSLDLKFPEDYRVEHLAGKDSRFEIQVKEVREQQLPEINEAFIKEFGIASGDQADFLADIRKNMSFELKQKLKGTIKDRVMDALIATHQLLVPEALINQEAEGLKKQTQQNMARQGHSSSLNLPLEIFKDQAKRRVTLGLLVGEIIKQHALKVEAERVKEFIEDYAQSYEQPQEVIDYYSNNKDARATVENLVLEDQVVDWVMQQVKIEDEPLAFDAFMNPGKE
ncbi:MAG: trigger factor, partial [Gammaproteobacteria bacterium]|nr:trigger factor [Gammaproteobacteria bacterium]